MIYDNCWLPETMPCHDWGKWDEYEERIYGVFKSDFIDNHPFYSGKRVQIRRHPVEYGREDTFWHVTCCDFSKTGSREPDPKRCERIKWIKAFIENSDCNKPACTKCDGMLVWSTIYQKTKRPRVKILLEEERYMVIVEIRDNYCLLITAYYIDHDHTMRKLINEYRRIKQ